jgi:integrase
VGGFYDRKKSQAFLFLGKGRQAMKGARHLSRQEIQNLAQSFYGEYEVRNRDLFLLGLNIGTRISELLALNVGDVWQYGPIEILELKKAITKGKKANGYPAFRCIGY